MTDDEVKYFEVINFGECFKSTQENLYSKLSKEQNLRKVAESFYVFLTWPDKVEQYVELMQSNSSNNSVHCHNI